MAEMKARERHLEAMRAAREQLREMESDTPHRRDLSRHVRRLEKELKAYDRLRRQG